MRKLSSGLFKISSIVLLLMGLFGFGLVVCCYDNYHPQAPEREIRNIIDAADQLERFPTGNFAKQSRTTILRVLNNFGLQNLISTDQAMELCINWLRNLALSLFFWILSKLIKLKSEEEEETSTPTATSSGSTSATPRTTTYGGASIASHTSTSGGSSSSSGTRTISITSSGSTGNTAVAKTVKTCENCMQSTNTNQDKCVFCGVKYTGRNIYAYIPSATAAAKRTCPKGHCYAVGTLSFCPDCGSEYPIVETNVVTKPSPPPVVEKPTVSKPTSTMRRLTDDDL